MRVEYSKLGLVATCMLSLWLMASFLDQKFSQKNLREMARTLPKNCHCPRISSRKCGCPHGALKCSTYLHIPGQSDWFDKRFKKAIDPLQRSEMPMSSDALILWMGLQGKPEMELNTKQQQQQQQTTVSPCRTCAVVGNSLFLRGSGLGFGINQHDVVLRISQASVQGFEMDVGNTTTMCIMYPEDVSIQDPGTQLLVLPMNSSGLQWFMNTLDDENVTWKPKHPGFQTVQFPGGNKKSKDKVLVISFTFLKYIQENWLKKQSQYPSLGFVALFYALHTCDQVSLFGFGTDNLKRWSHYWNDKHWFMNTMHNLKAEYNVIHRLHCEGDCCLQLRLSPTCSAHWRPQQADN